MDLDRVPKYVDETGDGLDWAGRGTSHVDFHTDETLPLSQGRFLGHGMNGGVFETVVCGQTVAWKRRYCRRQIGVQDLREMDILRKLDGRHIIKLVGTYTHGPFLGLLLWPVAVCDLGTFLEDVDKLLQSPGTGDVGIDYTATITQCLRSLGIDTPSSASTRLKQSIGCTSSAIAYLHQRSIRHKDIKPANILLSPAGLWVTDFGSSTDFTGISHSITQNGERGTPKYFAPEVAEYEPNGRSADIFSLGCVFLEMIGLCNGYSLEYLKSLRPNKDQSFHANLDSILHWFNFRETNVKSPADQQLMALVREMLARAAQTRPTAEHIETRLRLINTLRRPTPPEPLWGDCCAPVPRSSGQIQPHRISPVTIEIGNMHQSNNVRHEWHFFVSAPAVEDIIADVHFFLHPSFEHPYSVQHLPPFEMSGGGWGYFTISIVVALKRGYSWVSPDATLGPGDQSLLTLYWTLNFERELSYSHVEVGVAVS
ncbi:serine/threonine protein kinase [Penicillium lagena]|uniref:serine/threonine protein kinase n=1 Tax=Penicillium lagena TaxID=94218 RepID=UPI002541A8B3|nr:serine/threonine protein kinase [Penicillium lagena]KAJ5606268.1 serine/threonine protein kinase [Penicillium lagena]